MKIIRKWTKPSELRKRAETNMIEFDNRYRLEIFTVNGIEIMLIMLFNEVNNPVAIYSCSTRCGTIVNSTFNEESIKYVKEATGIDFPTVNDLLIKENIN